MQSDTRTKALRVPTSKRRVALGVSILLPLVAIILVAGVTGFFAPHFGAEPGRKFRAAIVIRDDVTAFQKWGTRAFTLGQLGANYDHVDYFTQSRDSQKQKEFVAALEAALGRYEAVDLFLLAHTNSYVEWVQSIDRKRRTKIRLVDNTGCWGAQQSEDWLDAGADVYVGHPGRSESPVFYIYFLRRWLRGMPIDDAVTASNENTRSVLATTGGLMYRGRSFDRAWGATRATISGVKDLSISRGVSP